MAKYIKTVPIEAEQFDGSDEMIKKYHIGFWKGIDTNFVYEYSIPTLEGNMDLGIGDWIATGVNGKRWPIAEDVFKQAYAELPVIPDYVAEYINYMKSSYRDIWDAIQYPLRSNNVSKYMEDNSETFARAWLDGYEVAE